MSNPPSNIQFNNRLLPILVFILLLLQLTIPYKGWLVLLIGLGGAWFISYLWAQSLAKGLQFKRETHLGWVQVGDLLEERFSLINQGWARGLWIELIDHSSIPTYSSHQLISIDAYNTIHWHHKSICTKRGLFTLGPTHLRTSDPLGFYSVSQTYPLSTTMVITPRIVALPTIKVAPGGRTGQGRPRSTHLEPTVSAATVRNYYPSDSLRQIHWPTSARRDILSVRLFDNTPAGDWWIFLDMDKTTQVGEGETSTEEHSVILAASLADRALQSHRAVGLVAYGEEMIWLPPREGDVQRWQILRALAQVKPGSHTLSDLLTRVPPTFGQLSSLIIITANSYSQWAETLLPLTQKGIVPTIILLDPLSFGGSTSLKPILTLLSTLDITTYVVTPDLLNNLP